MEQIQAMTEAIEGLQGECGRLNLAAALAPPLPELVDTGGAPGCALAVGDLLALLFAEQHFDSWRVKVATGIRTDIQHGQITDALLWANVSNQQAAVGRRFVGMRVVPGQEYAEQITLVHVTPIDEALLQAAFEDGSETINSYLSTCLIWTLSTLTNEVQYAEKFGGGRKLERTQDDVQLLYHYAKGMQ